MMFRAFAAGEERPNSQESRVKRRPLLRFTRSDGRLERVSRLLAALPTCRPCSRWRMLEILS